MSGADAPATRGPSTVPDVRLHLLDKWRDGGPFDVAFVEQSLRARMAGARSSLFKPERLWAQQHLKDATLFWVSEEMCDVVEAVAKGLPDDVTPADVESRWPLDSSTGLVVFERSIVGSDAMVPEHAVAVDAVLWGQTFLAEEPLLHAPARRCVSVGSYQRVDLSDPREHDVELAAAFGVTPKEDWSLVTRGVVWAALGRSDWPLVDRLDRPISERDSAEYRASCAEDRRLLAALHLVMNDTTALAEIEDHRPDKPTRRRSERKGHSASVKLVYLRRPKREGDGAGAGAKRHFTHSFVVQAFPRWQACGPRWTERKLVVVKSHVRGEGPLKPPGGGTVRVVK